MPRLTNPFTWGAELVDSGYSIQDALRKLPVPVLSKTMEEFGASTGSPDNKDAFASAVVWLNAQTEPACLVFNSGIYKYSESPNWAVDHASILTCGVVKLRNTGTGDSFILDGTFGDATTPGLTGVTNMNVGRFLIEGHDGSGDGVYIRGVHRSFFSFNVRGCGTTQAALRTEWCVVDEFQFTTSVNEGGWYNDGSGAAKPLYGAYLDERRSGEATSYCTFLNPILEGNDTGCYIVEGIGNNFYGGTMEACTNIGLRLGTNALWNKCYGADFEANTNHDIYIEGDNNHINGSDTLELITVLSGAKNNQITGGSHSQITINSGAVGTLVTDTTVNRFGDGTTLTDNGTNTRHPDVYDYGNEVWLLSNHFHEVCLSAYDAEPARTQETNLHGGLLNLSTANALNSGSPINETKGTGKVMIVINAGSDIAGGMTITGTSVDRETGTTTGSDTDDIVVDALTTDTSGTDGNGNTLHAFSGAYISSKWFTGAITISTADLTLTDVDVYHVSFEQFNDTQSYILQTFDMNAFTTNVAAEIDAYLYSLTVSGSKCEIIRQADLNVGTNGQTAIANQYWRLRRGNIGKVMNGSSDGMWADVFYSNSPSWVEDSTIKVWADVEL